MPAAEVTDAPAETAPRGTTPALVRAYRGERTARTPVWFMRQAGRSLPEYRRVREGTAMLDACLTPDLAAEITVQPVRRYRNDAAILFSDIVVPVRLAGVDVEIKPGVGPVMTPVRSAADVDRLPGLDPAALAPVTRAAALACEALAQLGPDGTRVPLIAFAGAPFTVASYLVEGGPSRDHLRTRALMHSDPGTWHRLLARVAGWSASFLQAQVAGGAEAAQVFDSWAGALGAPDYTRFALPHSRTVLQSVTVPRVHFGTGTGELLALLREAGADCVGVDHRVPLGTAVDRLGPDTVVQGNIDPALLLAPWPVLEAHVREVVAAGRRARAHVLNLGHGVPPEADPDQLARVVDLARRLDAEALGAAALGAGAGATA